MTSVPSVTVGASKTVIVILLVEEHPLAPVTVTVYVFELDGVPEIKDVFAPVDHK